MIYIVIMLLLLYLYLTTLHKEGFALIREEDKLQNKIYRNEKIYDNFYTYVYDDVILTIPYSVELIKLIHPYLYTYGESLCIGSKTGHLTQLLSKSTTTTGLESSSSMVMMSKYKYPDIPFVQGDYTKKSLFSANKFNHVIIPQLTLHTLCQFRPLCSTIKDWTVHGGYLFVCFTDIHTFPIYKLINHSPSDYFTSNYEYTVELKDNQLKETFRDKSFKERTNLQQLYSYTEKQIIYEARAEGFLHIKTLRFNSIPMSICVLQYK